MRKDVEKCTFNPNTAKKLGSLGQSKQISVKLFSDKNGVQMRDKTPRLKDQYLKTEGSLETTPVIEKKIGQNNEFFEYLAYHGVKNQKAQELDKLKAAEELASCTFQPALKKKSTTPNTRDVFTNLNNARKNTIKLEDRKEQLEMRDCTFKPSIDKKSEKLALTTRSSSKSYETLFKKHSVKMDRAKKLL